MEYNVKINDIKIPAAFKSIKPKMPQKEIQQSFCSGEINKSTWSEYMKHSINNQLQLVLNQVLVI